MTFTFNFFYPFMTVFTMLWASASCDRVTINHSPTNMSGSCTPATTTVPGCSRRTRTRASRSTHATGQSVLRRSARLRHRYKVPQKPILPSAPRRRTALRREGAIADLQQLEPGTPTVNNNRNAAPSQQLKREDSFVLVDYGNHFRMVKPAYAMCSFQSVPEHIWTVAPYHALGAGIGEQELRAKLLAVPIGATPLGTKRVRFMLEEDDSEEAEDARPRKRRKSN